MATLAFDGVRTGVTGACAAVIVVSCVATGCAGADSTARSTRTDAEQECVQAVFGVLSGMIDKPYDSQPFDEFVTRYGTRSITYTAYLDVFTSFYSLSASQGVPGAENRLRATVTRDCSAAS